MIEPYELPLSNNALVALRGVLKVTVRYDSVFFRALIREILVVHFGGSGVVVAFGRELAWFVTSDPCRFPRLGCLIVLQPWPESLKWPLGAIQPLRKAR